MTLTAPLSVEHAHLNSNVGWNWNKVNTLQPAFWYIPRHNIHFCLTTRYMLSFLWEKSHEMSKINISLLLLLIPLFGYTQGQREDDFRNYPIVITLQFQSFSMPFQNIKGHFRNIGIGIGTGEWLGAIHPSWVATLPKRPSVHRSQVWSGIFL